MRYEKPEAVHAGHLITTPHITIIHNQQLTCTMKGWSSRRPPPFPVINPLASLLRRTERQATGTRSPPRAWRPRATVHVPLPLPCRSAPGVRIRLTALLHHEWHQRNVRPHITGNITYRARTRPRCRRTHRWHQKEIGSSRGAVMMNGLCDHDQSWSAILACLPHAIGYKV